MNVERQWEQGAAQEKDIRMLEETFDDMNSERTLLVNFEPFREWGSSGYLLSFENL